MKKFKFKKFKWENIKDKSNGVKQFGSWRNRETEEPTKCQVKWCTKQANWMTTIKGAGLVFLCFGHGEDV